MDGANINGLFSGILQNPQMLNGILGLVSNLKDSIPSQSANVDSSITENNIKKDQASEKANEANDSENSFQSLASVLSVLGGSASGEKNRAGDNMSDVSHNRKNLLMALKPFMCRERCEKIDFILNVLTLLDMAQGLGITNLKI